MRRITKIYLLPFVSAILLSITRAPLHLNFLIFTAFIPFLFFMERDLNKKQIAISAFIFSSVYNLIVLHWITLVTIGGYFGLFLLFFFYYFLVFFSFNFFKNRMRKFTIIPFLFSWIIFEFLQNFGPFKFPWFNLGLSLTEYLPLLQIADIGGITLISILILVINFLIYKFIKTKEKHYLIICTLLFAIWFSYGFFRLNTIVLKKHKEKVSLIQVSFTREQKWDRSRFSQNLQIYKDFSKQASKKQSQLVIWPESAFTKYLLHKPQYIYHLKQFTATNNFSLLTGFPHYEYRTENRQNVDFYNSCALFSKNKLSEPYFKNILVPFGEQIPLAEYFPVLEKLSLGQANFTSGKSSKIYNWENYDFAPLICFEIAFPKYLQKIAQKDLDFFVNLTNDNWYGRSIGTYQHAEMVRIRAIETRKQIFRTANSGISLIINPLGETQKRLGLYKKGFIRDNIITTDSKSFYVNYMYYFEIIFLFLLLMPMIFIKVKKDEKILL